MNDNISSKQVFDKEPVKICPICKEATEMRIKESRFPGITTVGVACKCVREYNQRFRDEQIKTEINILRQKCFAHKCMFEWTFANDNGSNPQMSRAKEYLDKWELMKEKNIGLLLYGPVGTGKSYMAASIANALIDKQICVKMTNFPTIINGMYSADDKAEYVRSITNCELLIIDDLGVERRTEYSTEIVNQVIDYRYAQRKPLIITTNIPPEELTNEDKIELRRIYDRINEVCMPILIDGASLRQSKHEENIEYVRNIFSH